VVEVYLEAPLSRIHLVAAEVLQEGVISRDLKSPQKKQQRERLQKKIRMDCSLQKAVALI
jgi:hypothetical protein